MFCHHYGQLYYLGSSVVTALFSDDIIELLPGCHCIMCAYSVLSAQWAQVIHRKVRERGVKVERERPPPLLSIIVMKVNSGLRGNRRSSELTTCST